MCITVIIRLYSKFHWSCFKLLFCISICFYTVCQSQPTHSLHNITWPTKLDLTCSSYLDLCSSLVFRSNFAHRLMCHWLVFVVVFQESVVKTLGNKLDNDTLETFTLAEQLSTNLSDLNIRIEGTKQLCWLFCPISVSCCLKLWSRPGTENKCYRLAFGSWFGRFIPSF